MSKYKYTSYNYSEIVKPNIKVCYPNFNGVIQNAELKDGILYITFYDGVNRITVDINVTDLIEKSK
jgi:hypothetical protein